MAVTEAVPASSAPNDARSPNDRPASHARQRGQPGFVRTGACGARDRRTGARRILFMSESLLAHAGGYPDLFGSYSVIRAQ